MKKRLKKINDILLKKGLDPVEMHPDPITLRVRVLDKYSEIIEKEFEDELAFAANSLDVLEKDLTCYAHGYLPCPKGVIHPNQDMFGPVRREEYPA